MPLLLQSVDLRLLVESSAARPSPFLTLSRVSVRRVGTNIARQPPQALCHLGNDNVLSYRRRRIALPISSRRRMTRSDHPTIADRVVARLVFLSTAASRRKEHLHISIVHRKELHQFLPVIGIIRKTKQRMAVAQRVRGGHDCRYRLCYFRLQGTAMDLASCRRNFNNMKPLTKRI